MDLLDRIGSCRLQEAVGISLLLRISTPWYELLEIAFCDKVGGGRRDGDGSGGESLMQD